jgi:glycosyltransferase involved in cell wall biosynthesis
MEIWGRLPPFFCISLTSTPYHMSNDKLKILMCSEASFLNSGFGTYAREILSRLHKTNKYNIAEFASYGFINDPRDSAIDWYYYANAVRDNDPRYGEYMSRTDNQFGRWRFEKVLLDFKPDVVIDVRDYWMSAYQGVSPLRKFYHWILMPTVDSEPQQEEWIDTYLSADAVFSYSDWGAEVLKHQSSNKINYIDTASPGVDLDVFKRLDRHSIRTKYGIDQDAIIIGSVMRNQKRKLIPELFVTFRQTLDEISKTNSNIADKLFLYLHTSYPDMGWDIPELLKDNRLANKVLFTYSCKHCKNVVCRTFAGPQIICPQCLNKALSFPSVSEGVSSKTLSEIYNLFDLYVQYSICEGFGMPQVEAGACGTPIATVDYSAMCDIIHKLNAYKINIRSKFKELETKAYRVYPDNDNLKQHIINFINLSSEEIENKRKEIRTLTEQNYNWDHIASIWERYLDSLDQSGYRSAWNQPANTLSALPNLNNMQFDAQSNFDNLLGLCQRYLNNLSHIESLQVLNMLNNCDYGFVSAGINLKPYNFQNIVEYIQTYIANNNLAEQVRSQNVSIEEDFIKYAKIKGYRS